MPRPKDLASLDVHADNALGRVQFLRVRLRTRHIANGRSPDDALRWTNVSDQQNAEIVARTRKAADILVDID